MYSSWCVNVFLSTIFPPPSERSSTVNSMILREHGWQNPKWDHGKGRAQNSRVVEGSTQLHPAHLLFSFFLHPTQLGPLILLCLPYWLTPSVPCSSRPTLVHPSTPSFLSAYLLGEIICMCVTEDVICDQASTVAILSYISFQSWV